ncbi:LacI family DNA-binding transcriptional regulator [Microbacterium oryzae]|uniref:LacI family DNA-binding transcriptional regulator n=1 Tax=Microbacterium oryzae TaxID=743009 RepID=UPI0025B1C2D5|nr:LacI family DNA-binding transcriptional regulator [Microbacterium oryzae]MDN3312096.1 LacI family DNA-binding transcriptional regulator [Microbacterium oryzae]
MIPERRFTRRVNLTDIARACGVAPSTVSRALSNPGRVSAAMYELISTKAVEMGYASATLPQGPERRARGTIALVVPNLVNPFVHDLIRGSQAQAQAAGFLFLLVNTEESAHVELNWLKELSKTVDGVVLASPRGSETTLRSIGDATPLTIINREVPGISSVVIDTPSSSVEALHYLASLGHRRIAYVRGPQSSWTDHARITALEAAVKEMEVELLPIGAFHPSLSAGAAAADAVALSGATGALFFNDTLAIGAMMRFRQRGVDVPEKISVVGCDDIAAAETSSPPLTTVTASGERAGRAATELLIGQFTARTPRPRTERLAAHLTVRDSTGPVAAAE